MRLISKSQLAEMISKGTHYISCRMTKAQIKKLMIDKPAIQAYVLFDEDYREHFVPKKGA